MEQVLPCNSADMKSHHEIWGLLITLLNRPIVTMFFWYLECICCLDDIENERLYWVCLIWHHTFRINVCHRIFLHHYNNHLHWGDTFYSGNHCLLRYICCCKTKMMLSMYVQCVWKWDPNTSGHRRYMLRQKEKKDFWLNHSKCILRWGDQQDHIVHECNEFYSPVQEQRQSPSPIPACTHQQDREYVAKVTFCVFVLMKLSWLPITVFLGE